MNDHDKALQILQRDGHTKHNYHEMTEEGGWRHCSVGLFRQVQREENSAARYCYSEGRMKRAMTELAQVLGIYHPGRDAETCVVSWNDRDVTTADDVAHGLKLASEAHELAKEKR